MYSIRVSCIAFQPALHAISIPERHAMSHKATQPEVAFDELLTARDVAELYSISIREVYRKASSGELPKPIKLGHRTRRWSASVIQAHLDSLATHR
jgi:predicted DNA-binding transcriptional regulator AlpA